MKSMLALIAVASLSAGCVEPAPRPGAGNFRVVHFVPELRGAATYGYMSFDSLSGSLRDGATALGYRAGEQVPTKRYSDDHPDRTIYFLKPPVKDLKTRNASDWVAQRR